MGKYIPSGGKQEFFVAMEPIGDYHLSNIDWRVEYFASLGSVVIAKSDAVKDSDDKYFVTVDTSDIGMGKLNGILYPLIPDANSQSGYNELIVPFTTGEEIVDKYDPRLYEL